jgi:transcriptional regulator with XRE-family HTH domain
MSNTSPTHTIDRAELQRRRIEAGMSKTALAERAGVSVPTVCRIESGERRPSPALLVALARALDCGPADLMPSLVVGA